ncbi:Protein CBG00164 [Caenorhabditis briggsae]|uniref:Uncharacterized protein n=2 Tax=Caenorhabditis briggsae TaxID=6238 RepID=A0AAE9FJJ6_CAEBR|nr:Protein CBG00164 [Caenorhabditis briggsae]ULT83574.1 hypothetical protein L3Y34_012664 [Caenorhabditis briggsae]UMM42849.1 hypothetical protein L5515_018522 [Caenorhabditis briggsae]CAP21645.1 Protein CBG00164 [Caenorhabditis briggsae]
MSNDCKLIKDLRDKISKLVAVVKEHRAEAKQVNEPPKPEEIEMEVFYRRPLVTIKEPAYEERWSVIRRRPGTPTAPIDIIYPVREQDW